MSKGILAQAAERHKQIYVKGYDAQFVADHPEYYLEGQLQSAAVFTLTKDVLFIPQNWPQQDVESLCLKQGTEALKVAGSLMAAEYDRITNSQGHE